MSFSIQLRPTIQPFTCVYPSPLVISMFYGYFAQVERIKRKVKEKEEQARQQQKATQEIKRQREQLEVLHEVNLAATSTIDSKRLLNVFLEKALSYLPYAAALVRLRHSETGLFETATAKGSSTIEFETSSNPLGFVDENLEAQSLVQVGNVFTDPRIKDFELFRRERLVSFLGLPMVANGTFLGSLIFLTKEEHHFAEEEIGFLLTLTGQLAIAYHHAQLFNQIQRQANELRQANQVKDEFLGVVLA